MSKTLQYGGPEDTLLTPSSPGKLPTLPAPVAVMETQRSTVLPRVEWKGTLPDVVASPRERFEELGTLGQGGMGEVVLLKDHDIERTVALKRLPSGSGPDFVYRFVEEIRTVGHLDHPNIVPVHDVGVDARGRYFFMMKHLQGETLESIIAKLKQGDAATHKRFSFQTRIQIFQGILQAISYAHEKGVIHRDLKPSNIMVGPYGEVTVMDWGLARRQEAGGPEALGAPVGTETTQALRDAAMLRTQLGSVMGTPLYMSPEQARGQHPLIDARSDIYSLSVMFYEFLFLKHYLEGRKSLQEILDGVQNVMPSFDPDDTQNPVPVPAELVWFLKPGLRKKVEQRYASVNAMKSALQSVQEGNIDVHCHRTAMKRGLHEMARMVDLHSRMMMLGIVAATGFAIFGMIQVALQILK